MNENEIRLLLKIATMYYEQDMTQSQISKELSINRTTISRNLKKIREKGIVKISIDYSIAPSFDVEQQLINKFSLKDAIVVNTGESDTKEEKLRRLGIAAAEYLDQIITDSDVIGFSWGSSLYNVVNSLETTKDVNATFVPLIGGPLGKLEGQYHVNAIVYQAAQKYNGRSLLIDLPAIIKDGDARQYFVNSEHYKEISEYWNQLTISLLGIGSIEIAGNSIWKNFYEEEVIREAEKRSVVGDILSQFYDLDGNLVETSLSNRLTAFNINQLQKARYSIGIAESMEKVKGIIGALNGGYINVLITTDETAKFILSSS